MKKILLPVISCAVIATSAMAADLPSRKEAILAPVAPTIWTGFYAGLNAGYNFGTNSNIGSQNWAGNWVNSAVARRVTSIATAGPFAMDGWGSNTQSGFIGGAQFGYNYQWGDKFLIGVETDIQGTSTTGTTRVSGAAALMSARQGSFTGASTASGASVVNAGVSYLGTVRGRLGYLFNPTLLLYGTGGFAYGGAWANVNQSSSEILPLILATGNDLQTTWVGSGTQNQLLTGWTAGGGAEWMFLPNWSLKGEALYWDLGRMSVQTTSYASAPFTGAIQGLSNNIGWGRTSVNYSGIQAKVGVNYHFTLGSVPVVAKF